VNRVDDRDVFGLAYAVKGLTEVVLPQPAFMFGEGASHSTLSLHRMRLLNLVAESL